MPDIESIGQNPKSTLTCNKKFLETSPSGWKFLLGFYLKKIGGRFLFQCNFDFTKLPTALPDFYEECIPPWSSIERGQPFLAFRYSKSGLMEQQVYMH